MNTVINTEFDTAAEAVSQWSEAQMFYVQAREDYRRAYAEALLTAEGKTEAARKSEADAKTSELRLTRDRAETQAAALWQLLLIARGRVESSAQPGRHFGEEG
jgi:hypothetical protein